MGWGCKAAQAKVGWHMFGVRHLQAWRRGREASTSAASSAGDPADLRAWRHCLVALRVLSVLVLVLMLALVLSTILGVPSGWHLPKVRSVLMALLLSLTAVWFIVCFTAPSGASYLRHVYVFAYAFTFGSFALLVTPFVSTQDEASVSSEAPTVGVLQLVRGCVHHAFGDEVGGVSPVGLCPRKSWPGLPEKSQSKDAVEPTASRAEPDSGQEVDRYYHWMISMGGVTVRKFVPIISPCVAGCEGASNGKRLSYVEVHGGLALPLFVVVLSFIGGAVSLSRRIPEYQRRSEEAYVPTEREAKMAPFQAREAVVFQIMQLVSAPFLAMATWYIVTPSTLGAAALLAFGTGFASEPLLMMIRGMVEGIRPEGTRVPASRLGVITGTVKGAPAGELIQVKVLDTNLMVETDPQGRYAIPGVPVGKAVVEARSGKRVSACAVNVQESPPAMADFDLGVLPPELSVVVQVSVTDVSTLDDGSLSITVDGQPQAVSEVGTFELKVAPGASVKVQAKATRQALSLEGELVLTPTVDDGGRVFTLELK